jgi:septum formation topological specificity factor MinE
VVGQHIVEQYNKDKKKLYKRYMRSELIDLVKKWVQLDEDINVETLNEKWVRALSSA